MTVAIDADEDEHQRYSNNLFLGNYRSALFYLYRMNCTHLHSHPKQFSEAKYLFRPSIESLTRSAENQVDQFHF